jgi:hypothetical protein
MWRPFGKLEDHCVANKVKTMKVVVPVYRKAASR